MKKFYYYLYLILTLAFMLLTSVASFVFFNAYVGAIVSGLYITAICFYYNQYAGYIASGLFLVMCCFFANLYAGIIASAALVIIIAFYLDVLAGLVPTGLVIVAACFYYNTFAGIFALGLFLIYLLFLVVHCCGWKKSIIWSSAVYILVVGKWRIKRENFFGPFSAIFIPDRLFLPDHHCLLAHLRDHGA